VNANDIHKVVELQRCMHCDHWAADPTNPADPAHDVRHCSKTNLRSYKFYGCGHWESSRLEVVVRRKEMS
jgi:hypothetical protein